MALHTYTAADYMAAAKRSIGNSVDVQLGDFLQLVNDALMRLTTAHQWAWRRASMTLDSVASQNYIALPADLGSVELLHCVGQLGAAALPVPLSTIVYMRANNGTVIENSQLYHYAVTWTHQASTTALPIPRLELYPTPDDTVTGLFEGVYQKITPKLAAAASVPDIPASFHVALRYAVQWHAMQDHGVKGWDDKKALYDEEVKSLLATEDGLLQPSLGMMNGIRANYSDRAVIVPPTIISP